MKIAVFGGTGRTGIHVVKKALAEGYVVTALARSPEKMTVEDEGLTVIEGEATDRTAVNKTIEGTDAVISALTPVPQAIDNIIGAMKANGVERLIVTAGAGVYRDGDDPPFVSKIISTFIKIFSREAYDATFEVAQAVEKSGLDWTLARAPRLLDKPATGNLYVGPLDGNMKPTLSREDYAAFMVDQVGKDTYIGKTPVISDK